MEHPWVINERSSRDRLFDIAAKVTMVYSFSSVHDSTQVLSRYLELHSELDDWRQNWLHCEYPGCSIPCRGCHEWPCLCFPHHRIFPSNEFTYMVAECLALLLLCNYMASHLSKLSHDQIHELSRDHTFDTSTLERRVCWLQDELRRILTLPCFGQALSDVPGITEGRCRSLLPAWVLSQTSNASEGCPESKWWSQLNSRVNYGVF